MYKAGTYLTVVYLLINLSYGTMIVSIETVLKRDMEKLGKMRQPESVDDQLKVSFHSIFSHKRVKFKFSL